MGGCVVVCWCAGFCTEPPEEDVSAQHRARLWSHLRDCLQHPRSKYRAQNLFVSKKVK